ncbi:MAG: homoserine O-acetyltransferase [Candidatus Cryptobacteroides sp.]
MVRHEYIHNEVFEFESGGSLTGLKLVYHTSDVPWSRGDGRKVVWICHALTANSDAQDWWPEMVGPGRLFDTDRHFVICVNMLCSSYGSSGPATVDPETGKPYFFTFPKTTVRDMVRAEAILCRHLGIDRIDLMVGGSIGGFQAIEWTIMEPELVRQSVFIACGARVTPWLTAWEETQRMALEADPTFRECANLRGGEAGLRCARGIAMLSYRSYKGYNTTQEEVSEDCLFADRAGSYQRYQGKKLADRFDAYSYYYLSLSVDSNNAGRGRGGLQKALGSIKVKCTVVGIDSDALFPTVEQKLIASYIGNSEYFEITSAFGHDGFLLEWEQLTGIMAPLLK